jgi:hypothetical protein
MERSLGRSGQRLAVDPASIMASVFIANTELSGHSFDASRHVAFTLPCERNCLQSDVKR